MQTDMKSTTRRVVRKCDPLHRQSGTVAVECALVLPLMIAVMVMVLHLGLLCIRKQHVIYSTYMAMRAQVIAADVTRATQLSPGDNPICNGGGAC